MLERFVKIIFKLSVFAVLGLCLVAFAYWWSSDAFYFREEYTDEGTVTLYTPEESFAITLTEPYQPTYGLGWLRSFGGRLMSKTASSLMRDPNFKIIGCPILKLKPMTFIIVGLEYNKYTDREDPFWAKTDMALEPEIFEKKDECSYSRTAVLPTKKVRERVTINSWNWSSDPATSQLKTTLIDLHSNVKPLIPTEAQE